MLNQYLVKCAFEGTACNFASSAILHSLRLILLRASKSLKREYTIGYYPHITGHSTACVYQHNFYV